MSTDGSAGKGEEPVVILLTPSSAQSSRCQPALRSETTFTSFSPCLPVRLQWEHWDLVLPDGRWVLQGAGSTQHR